MSEVGCDKHKRFIPSCEECMAPPANPSNEQKAAEESAREYAKEYGLYPEDVGYNYVCDSYIDGAKWGAASRQQEVDALKQKNLQLHQMLARYTTDA